MSLILTHQIGLIIIMTIINSIKSQINVLAPPAIVQKVKELENGSKTINIILKNMIYRNQIFIR